MIYIDVTNISRTRYTINPTIFPDGTSQIWNLDSNCITQTLYDN